MSIAVTDWNGRVSPVFDVAQHVVIEQQDGAGLWQRSEEPLPGERGEERIEYLLALGVSELVCGAISRHVRQYGIRCGLVSHSFVSGPVDAVLEARREGRLAEPPFVMPGCGQHGRCRRRGYRTGGGVCQQETGQDRQEWGP